MTERQARILNALIREYIRAAGPVGSEVLVERSRLPYSSATVRAEFSTLEEEGYLEQPHASAGRIPTRRGYRHFVDRMDLRPLSPTELRQFAHELQELRTERDRLARRTAKLLAGLTGHLAVTGIADTDDIHEAGLPELLEEPEFSTGAYVRDVSRVLDTLDEHLKDFARINGGEPHVYIGDENPYVPARHVSLVVIPCRFPSGERGILAVIGPLRMRYDRNVRLLESAARLFANTGETP